MERISGTYCAKVVKFMLGFQRNGTRWYYRYPDEAPVLEKCVLFSIQVIFNPHK